MKRLIWWGGALVVVVAAAYAGWTFLRAPETDQVPRTVPVARGTVEETVLASGIIEASALVSVGAEVSGRIKSVNVALGDEVAAGDVIAEIDSLNQENAVKSAEAALANVMAQMKMQDASLAQARAALARSEQLHAQALIADTVLQDAQLAVTTAEAQQESLAAQISQAEINVERAQLDLSRTKIVAPIAGTVVAVLVEVGQSVNASSAAPTIVKIADLDDMVVKAEISEADVPRVEPGQTVYFTILGDPEGRIEATMRSIEPAPESIASEAATGSSTGSAIYYNGLFDVPNPDRRLRISMTAQVTIVLESAANVLTIPSALLGRRTRDGDYRLAVWDEDAGVPVERVVRIGLNNNVVAEVLSGLEEGELVVATTPAASTSTQGNGQRPGGLFGGGPVFRGG